MEQISLEQKTDSFTASTGVFDLILVINGIQPLDISKENVEPEFSNLSNHYHNKMKLCVETKYFLKRNFCPDVVYSFSKGDYRKLAELLIILNLSLFAGPILINQLKCGINGSK